MLLELRNIKKYYTSNIGLFAQKKNIVKAVDGVSLRVDEGESLSIVGESGCGKTTLARMIAKLIPITSGSIVFQGKDVSEIRGVDLNNFRRNMQIVFQDPYSSLDPRFTVSNIINEGMTLGSSDYPTETSKEARVVEMLGAVGLDLDVMNRYPHEFSGGERQRIAIARALVLNPKLLILDEAVSSLDVVVQRQVLDLLVDIKAKFNLTYIFISHNLKVVKQVSDKIAVMYNGKIVEFAYAKDILNNPLHEYTKELLSAAIDYKCIPRSDDIIISESQELLHNGGEHYVLQ